MKNTKRRKLFASVVNNVDATTGEIIERVEHFVKEVKRDDFIKFYVMNTATLLGLKDHELRLLLALLEHMKYNNAIYMTKEVKALIGKSLGRSPQRISDTLTDLVKKEALYRMSNGHYAMNPDLFFKGDDINRIALFKRITEIKIVGNTDSI